jgi:dihydrolipoamide dehydrogenase
MVVFSEPEIASVGLTEKEALAKGYMTKTGKMPFSASGKAKTIASTGGFVKVVADGKGMVLGVHVIGPGAENIIAEAALALEMAATLEDLAITIHAHPTLPETLGEAAEDALGKAIHLYRGKKK